MSASASSLFEIFEATDQPRSARRQDPVSAAFERGRAEGLTEGALAGRAQGRQEGHDDGYAAGHAEGLEAGRAQGAAEAAEARDASLAAIAECWRADDAARSDQERRLVAAASTAMRTAIAAALPRVARLGLADEAAALCREILATAALGRAVLRIAPAHAEAAREALDDLASRSRPGDAETTLEVTADPGLSETAARLEWRDGLSEIDGEEIAERILARLDRALTAEAAGGDADEAVT